MISQGATEQSPLVSGYNRTNLGSSGRILETNTENLLRMVSEFYHCSFFLKILLEYKILIDLLLILGELL